MGIDVYEQASRGFEAAEARLQAAETVDEDVALDFLATLPPFDYDRTRKKEAQRLGVRIAQLDKAVAERREQRASARTGGSSAQLVDFEPSEESVNGDQMMRLLVATIERYVIVSAHGAVAIALWIVRAHAYECFDINPRLAFLSPEKRCGKSTALEVVAALTPRSILASNATPASLFRMIEAEKPTIILDEMDTFKDSHPELRGILNSGHRRTAAYVLRCVGDEHDAKAFSTWCPMVFAAIGKLPDTLEDRSIIIRMRRRAKNETVHRLRWTGQRGDTVRASLMQLGRAVARWVLDHAESLRQHDPIISEPLHDRAADNWASLLVVADLAGGEWSERARAAAIALSKTHKFEDDSFGVQLMSDIRMVFGESGAERLPSKQMCDRLAAREERPWRAWRQGRPITPAQVARLLRPFEIASQDIWQQGRCIKGYVLRDFAESFARYLPDSPPQSDQDPPLRGREDARRGSSSGVFDNVACARQIVSRVSINERISNPGALPRGLAGKQPGGAQKTTIDAQRNQFRELWRRAKPIHEARK
jgi:putative DNA primase/helicase